MERDLGLCLIWSVHLKAEDADSEPLLENDRIQIEYVKPGESVHAGLRDNEGAQSPQRLKQFLSP